MIINGLIIGGAVVFTFLVLGGMWWWLGREDGQHAADPFTVPPVHHEEYGGRSLPPPSTHDLWPMDRPHADVPGREPPVALPPGGSTGEDAPASQATAEAAHPAGDSPVATMAAATAAVIAQPLDDYVTELTGITAYTDREPLASWLSDDTLARGFKAVK